MTRLWLGLLMVLNLLVFLYGRFGLDRPAPDRSGPRRLSDVGSIRLVSARILAPGEAASSPAVPAEEPREEGGQTEPVVADEPPAAAAEPKTTASEAPASEPLPSPAPPAAGAAPAETAEVPAPVEQAAPAPAEPPACGEIGPFRSRIQARRLAEEMGNQAAKRIGRRPTPVDVAYWVLRPPLPDRGLARQEVARLKKAGVVDLWLMPDGEFRNGISLGLYSHREAAEARAELLRKKGFEVEVRPRRKKKERYWIEFSGVSRQQLERLGERLPQGVALREKVCGEAFAAP